jgi:protein-L-isoaspartate(D-aspartate) O-methyltransferase
MDRLESHRTFFANLITAAVPKNKARLQSAFAATHREHFLGPGPWKVFVVPAGYIETPTDDPAFVYQDVVVGLAPERLINNGQPTLHALLLAALDVVEGETVLHVGCGTGFYTGVLAHLAGPTGSVVAYEVEADLAQAATRNLAHLPNVVVETRSASEGKLPECDVLYVNAGATAPLDVWLDALRPGGRLLFPLTGDGHAPMLGVGAMLLVTRTADPQRFDAWFVCPAAFIPCRGARDEETGRKLGAAFLRGDARNVRSLRRRSTPDGTAWFAGTSWWLSTV